MSAWIYKHLAVKTPYVLFLTVKVIQSTFNPYIISIPKNLSERTLALEVHYLTDLMKGIVKERESLLLTDNSIKLYTDTSTGWAILQ